MTMPAPADWTYTPPAADADGNWVFATDKDAVRLAIADTDPEFRLLSDAEISYLLSVWMPRYGSTTFVAAVAARLVSRKFAGIVTVAADGVSVNTADLTERYRQIAEDLRAEYAEEGDVGAVIDLGNLFVGAELDQSIKPLVFAEGMHDNPAAGQQDFGGVVPIPVWVADPNG